MGHHIHGFVFGDTVRRRLRESRPGWKVVALAPGFHLAPLPDVRFDELAREFVTHDYPPPLEFEYLSGAVAHFGKLLSREEPVAYVETNYWGGIGSQGAVAWHHGKEIMAPRMDERGPINEALRIVGVVAGSHPDEFEAVHLGRHGDDESWIKDASSGE